MDWLHFELNSDFIKGLFFGFVIMYVERKVRKLFKFIPF